MRAIKVGTEFLVNTETDGDQWAWRSVTGLTNCGFVVTWSYESGTIEIWKSSDGSRVTSIAVIDGTGAPLLLGSRDGCN